jgi:hypothetical protein
LFKGVVNGFDVAYVRCYCPSTDRMFFLGVEPKTKNAKDGIASLYRIPRKLKAHIEAIHRQGEVYSTILTPEGEEINKSLTKEEIADQVSINGDIYFDLIKYEY